MESNMRTLQPKLPRYAAEGAFCRLYLRIDPETGKRYLRAGLFAPDALSSSGKPLFRIDGRAISRIKKVIARHRKAKRKSSNLRVNHES
jgi:hypothetical protein